MRRISVITGNFRTFASSNFGLSLLGSLGRDSLWILFARVLCLVLQIAYFTIIARHLGVEQYGLFVSVLSLARVVNPFASFGSAEILVKNVSRDRTLLNEYWGNALFITLVGSLTVIVLLLFVKDIFLPETISPHLVFLIALAEVLFDRIAAIQGYAFMAVGALNKTAQLTVVQAFIRFIAAVGLVIFFPTTGVLLWASLYLLSTTFTAILAFLIAYRTLGFPRLALSKFKPEIAQGFSFSISSSSLTAYNDIDKTLLARLSTLEATGIYAAAYRFINIAFVPTHSLLVASYPVFFRRGAVGIGGSLSFAKRLAPPVIVYSCVVVIGLLILAPVAPYILGNEYNLAVEAIRWLAPIPFLSAMHYLAGDILTGAGSQGVRSGIQIMAALFNVAMNLWLIPMYSWKGAAWSSLASEALLALSLWGVIFFYRRRQNSR